MLNIIPDLSYTEHNIPLWFLAYHVIETKVSLPNKPEENIKKNAFKRANQISVYHGWLKIKTFSNTYFNK